MQPSADEPPTRLPPCLSVRSFPDLRSQFSGPEASSDRHDMRPRTSNYHSNAPGIAPARLRVVYGPRPCVTPRLPNHPARLQPHLLPRRWPAARGGGHAAAAGWHGRQASWRCRWQRRGGRQGGAFGPKDGGMWCWHYCVPVGRLVASPRDDTRLARRQTRRAGRMGCGLGRDGMRGTGAGGVP